MSLIPSSDPQFTRWLKRVSRLTERHTLSILTAEQWWNLYTFNYTPKQAADLAEYPA